MKAFRVFIARAEEDAATALLWELGTAGLEVRSPSGEELELLAYFPEKHVEAADVISALALLAGARVEATLLPEVDWVARFRETFRAFRAGRFVVAPPWDLPEDHSNLLIVEPGRAFGTGTHETTRLCLAALQSLAETRALGRVLDLGAGTGLLALAAALLGARLVAAVDIDPEAIESARRHARLNRASILIVRADGGRAFRAGSFDLVLANLTTRLLLDRREEIEALRARAGALVLGGMLIDDVPAVREAYRATGVLDLRTDGEWAALIARASRS